MLNIQHQIQIATRKTTQQHNNKTARDHDNQQKSKRVNQQNMQSNHRTK